MPIRREVDLPPGRVAETLATWLQDHPGINISGRNRAGAYADGSRIGAPQAIQVTDAFHLWQNLDTGVGRCVPTTPRLSSSRPPAHHT